MKTAVNYQIITADDYETTMGIIRANDIYARFSGELDSAAHSTDSLVGLMETLKNRLNIDLRCEVIFYEVVIDEETRTL